MWMGGGGGGGRGKGEYCSVVGMYIRLKGEGE